MTFLTFYLVVAGFSALVCLLLMLDADRRERETQLKAAPRVRVAWVLSTIIASLVLSLLWPTFPFVLIWSNVTRRPKANRDVP